MMYGLYTSHTVTGCVLVDDVEIEAPFTVFLYVDGDSPDVDWESDFFYVDGMGNSTKPEVAARFGLSDEGVEALENALENDAIERAIEEEA
jgi:hypothetical protein